MATPAKKLTDFEGNHPAIVKIPKNRGEKTISWNQTAPQSLHNRIVSCMKAIGVSNEQELVRIGMTLFLERNGF